MVEDKPIFIALLILDVAFLGKYHRVEKTLFLNSQL